MTDTLNEQSYEQNMARLQKVVNSLERDSLGLEDSLQLFEEGMALAECCEGQLNVVEERIKVLVEGSEPLATRADLPLERLQIDGDREGLR